MTDREFEQCMSAMAAGDRDSLRHIYDAYLKLIYAVVYDTIGQREEAEDVTSEFFIKLYSIAGSYKPGNGHKKWLVTIARNMAVSIGLSKTSSTAPSRWTISTGMRG